jgi:integrase
MDADRSIPRTRLEKLFTDDRHGLPERVLWRMLYETAARAEEILTLNIEDLDLEFRRARVTSKDGAIEYVHWATVRLLPRLLRGRTTGPVFLADRRAPASGRRAPATKDICPATGRGRMSYPRAEYLFKQASAALDPHEKGWTLHQLRHSALQHPGRRRPHRSRAPGQVPPPAPGQPRPLCPARRADLRPRHRRSRSSHPPPHTLTISSAQRMDVAA